MVDLLCYRPMEAGLGSGVGVQRLCWPNCLREVGPQVCLYLETPPESFQVSLYFVFTGGIYYNPHLADEETEAQGVFFFKGSV